MSNIKGPGQALNVDGSRLKIGIVHARWNTTIIESLLAGALSSLRASGVKDENIVVESVPGSWELPVACSMIIHLDAVIAIGVLIKGDTMHFEYISNAVSEGLMRVQLDTKVPLIFGLLTALCEDQAMSRAGMVCGSHNHGEDWGNAALELGSKGQAYKLVVK